MRKRILSVALVGLALLLGLYYVGSGFRTRGDVMLTDYRVSEDETELTFRVGIMSSVGYTRGYADKGGGLKPHYLRFYSTFGGLNCSLGAKSEFTLELGVDDREIYFQGFDGGYRLVLEKNEAGEWVRPETE